MENLREFCADSLRQKKLSQEFKDRSDPLRQALKQTKTKIENFMIQNDVETAKISLTNHEPPVTYLTRNTKVQCRRITLETLTTGLEHCFENIETSLLRGGDTEMLCKYIWDNINRARQVDKLTLRIAEKPEDKRKFLKGGDDAPYALDLSEQLGVLVSKYWSITNELKRLRKTKKEKQSVLGERIKNHCPIIMKHMNSRGKTSQRINMRHNNTPCSFYVRLKTSSTKPTIKKSDMFKIITDAISTTPTITTDTLQSSIVTLFESIPHTSCQKVTLDRGHYQSVVENKPVSTVSESAGLSVFDEAEDSNDANETETS